MQFHKLYHSVINTSVIACLGGKTKAAVTHITPVIFSAGSYPAALIFTYLITRKKIQTLKEEILSPI